MKITFFIGCISGGGAERITSYLANYLARKGHIVTILTMSDVKDLYELDNRIHRDCLINKYERKNILYDFVLRYYRLGKYMKSHNCDCYVVMLPVTIMMMLMHRNKTNAAVIASERNNPTSYNIFVHMIQKWLAKRADAWVFQTENARISYGKSIKKYVVIPNTINEKLLNRETKKQKKNEIIAVGRLDKQKNYDMMLHAFSQLKEKYPDYILRIMGKGPLEGYLKNLTKELGIEQSVFFEGYVENVWEIMENGCMYVLSSDFEGMPNTLIEAMVLGMPCISTDCLGGGPAFLIENRKNGLLVPMGDAKALALACEWVINNKDKADKMGMEARKIRELLAPNIINNNWEKLITTIVEEKNDKSQKLKNVLIKSV